MTPLPKARSGLLRHELDDQVLVYDSDNDKVHLLDPVTASVLEQLQAGNSDESSVRDALSRNLGIDAGSDALPLAIDQLHEAGLTLPDSNSRRLGDVTRRQLVGRLVAAGAAAFLIPAIVTMTANSAAGQSITAGNAGGACLAGNTCNSGNRCCAGTCLAGCAGNGQCCSLNSDCCNVTQGAVCTGSKVCNK